MAYSPREHYGYGHSRRQSRQRNWLLIFLCVGIIVLLLDGQDDTEGGQQEDDRPRPVRRKRQRRRAQPLVAESPLEKDLNSLDEVDAVDGVGEEGDGPVAARSATAANRAPRTRAAATLPPGVVDAGDTGGHKVRLWRGGGHTQPNEQAAGDTIGGVGVKRATPAPPTDPPLPSTMAVSHTHLAIHCEQGHFLIQMHPESAPRTVEHLVKMVQSGTYSGANFYRFDRSFLLQGGVWPAAPRVEKVPVEYALPNSKWTVGLQHAPLDSSSGTTEFYINLANNTHKFAPHHGRGGYSVFGTVIGGYNTIEQMEKLPTHYDRKTYIGYFNTSVPFTVELVKF